MQDAHVTPPCNCLALRQAARQATQFYDRRLAATGLRTSQFSILATLARRGALSVNQLADAMVMDRTTVGRAVRPLEREGLAEVGPGRDGRTRALKVTDAGRERLAQALPLWREAQSAFEKRYGPPDAAALRTALSRVVTAL
jgi:DNA-binding MarR family transcriptional regulator